MDMKQLLAQMQELDKSTSVKQPLVESVQDIDLATIAKHAGLTESAVNKIKKQINEGINNVGQLETVIKRIVTPVGLPNGLNSTTSDKLTLSYNELREMDRFPENGFVFAQTVFPTVDNELTRSQARDKSSTDASRRKAFEHIIRAIVFLNETQGVHAYTGPVIFGSKEKGYNFGYSKKIPLRISGSTANERRDATAALLNEMRGYLTEDNVVFAGFPFDPMPSASTSSADRTKQSRRGSSRNQDGLTGNRPDINQKDDRLQNKQDVIAPTRLTPDSQNRD